MVYPYMVPGWYNGSTFDFFLCVIHRLDVTIHVRLIE